MDQKSGAIPGSIWLTLPLSTADSHLFKCSACTCLSGVAALQESNDSMRYKLVEEDLLIVVAHY